MSESSDESILDGEDYYTFLNIPRDATDEDICNSYRRLSRLYHPDKHQHPDRKKEAEILFSKTKKAYEVLIDGHQRAIYDNLGVAGLATQGWEVVHRTKTPQEIREEYERLAREREERRLQARTNPKSSVSMTINATELFATGDDDTPYLDLRDIFGLPHIEISGMSLNQSIEAPLTSKDTAILSGQLSSHNGRGNGTLSCALRRVLSERGWAEVELGTGAGLSCSIKCFRSFYQGFFANAALQANVTPNGIRLGSIVTVANQLDQQTTAYLTWKLGTSNGLTTMVIRDTERLHAVASMHFGVPQSYVSMTYMHKMPDHEIKLKLTAKVGTFGGLLEYSVEKQVSLHSHFSATMSLGVPLGVQLRLRLRRASQTYTCNIVLCDDLLPAPIVYGTLLPLVGWVAIDRLIVKPFLDEQKRQNMARQRESNKVRISELKREAAAAVELMRETVKRNIDMEENKKGLVILKAMYGRLVSSEADQEEATDDVLNVTIQLQCLVKDSKLILQESSKCQLPGLYDTCPGEEKTLYVSYLFHALVHKVTIKDREGLRIPKQSHRVDQQ
uniref:DnaJ-like protein subfamily C member 11 n=2 Tax=Hirondellea gigas TaxID=1518452 RepID=A0A6A7FM57_9CRUS